MANDKILKWFVPLFCCGVVLVLVVRTRAEIHAAIRSHLPGADTGSSAGAGERIRAPAADADPEEHPGWSWPELFSYVPYGVEDCKKLFRSAGEYTPKFKAEYDTFLAEVKKYNIAEGTSAQYKEEFLAYIQAVQAPFVRTVCETGFNAGHSTFAWLAANPETHVYSFDMASHDYAKPMAKYLGERFPGRLNITWGDSMETLPRFRRDNPDIRCDLIIIDGGHTFPTCKSDFNNFRKMANSNNIVILDNFPDDRWGFLKKLGPVWENAKRNAELAEIYKCHYKDFKQGFSVGRMILS